MEKLVKDPVFVFGALRSGTTLMRLMLDNHPGITAPGEADFLFDHISRDSKGDWRYDLDALRKDWIVKVTGVNAPEDLQGTELMQALIKTLSNSTDQIISLNIHRNADILNAFFPKAKIIHLLRDPRDVARSSIGMGWSGNSYFGVRHWIETEQSWERAGIEPERVLVVHFEQLMSSLEEELTRICEFLELSFAPAMLDYHETSSYQPPNPNIAGKWRGKATPREIALIEGQAGTLMESRGYDLSGAPAQPSPFEHTRLRFDNMAKRWQFNIKRYGLGLFVKHHAARFLGLTSLTQKFAAQQESIRLKNLQ